MKRILGIDPGFRHTGYSVIESNGRAHRHIAGGVINIAGLPPHERLGAIFDGVLEVIQTHQPLETAVEEVFLAKNAAVALKLGQARGAAICAAVKAGLPVHEYSAKFIKKAVTGGGAADKRQVQYMVCRLLGIAERERSDESDALAAALCHAFVSHVRRPAANPPAHPRAAEAVR